MRIHYYCPYCDQRSTRRWNLEVHIKRKHDGSPGQYLASHPSLPFSYKPTNPYHNIESTAVADNRWDSFQPVYGLQQAPVGTSQYSTSPVYPHKQIMDYQRYHGRLSKDTLLRIDQLKRLLNKYPQFFTNPNQILTWTINWAVNGDNKIFGENLEQLRYIDNLAKSRHFIER